MSPLDEALERAAQEADLYEQSVQALLTFAAMICHDGTGQRDDAKFGFGRRMHIAPPLPAGKDDPELGEPGEEAGPLEIVPQLEPQEVTPDLVAQGASTYGVAVEVKAGLASGDDVWNAYADQVLKYAVDLEGWWTSTERIESSDAVLVLHRSRARRFVRFIAETDPPPMPVQPGLAVVEFVRSEQIGTFFSFTLEWGNLHDRQLQEALAESREIPLEKVIETYAQIQFYDVEPPLPTLLEIMWGEFLSRIGELERAEDRGCWLLRTTADEVTEELQRSFGSRALHQDQRSVEFPRVSWIRNAMQKLVLFGLAERAGEDEFVVFVKILKQNKDLRDEFVRRLLALGDRSGPIIKTTPDQTSLPLDTD